LYNVNPNNVSLSAIDTAQNADSADTAASQRALPPNTKTPAAATRANLPVGVTKSSTAPVEPAGSSMLNQALNSALLARGDALFVSGDIASARLFYERAANAGDGHAALRLGETYDPAFLARTGLIGSRENASVAAYWYQRASELGVPDGEILLKAIAAETGH
jgi:TPR repeat protein